jgi:putative transposase
LFVAEQLATEYGKHPVHTDGGTWYPQACKFLKLKHHLDSSFEKSIIERTIQYVKDRTESFDDYFPCRKNKCRLEHVMHWLNLFVDMHNETILQNWLKLLVLYLHMSSDRVRFVTFLIIGG